MQPSTARENRRSSLTGRTPVQQGKAAHLRTADLVHGTTPNWMNQSACCWPQWTRRSPAIMRTCPAGTRSAAPPSAFPTAALVPVSEPSPQSNLLSMHHLTACYQMRLTEIRPVCCSLPGAIWFQTRAPCRRRQIPSTRATLRSLPGNCIQMIPRPLLPRYQHLEFPAENRSLLVALPWDRPLYRAVNAARRRLKQQSQRSWEGFL
mmetsp:Transcript_246/g.773  ORF Transcript_246/g.773 Transcript_246/m.773 type:complete len:206 (+) Transcript_246:1195-1812(+)